MRILHLILSEHWGIHGLDCVFEFDVQMFPDSLLYCRSFPRHGRPSSSRALLVSFPFHPSMGLHSLVTEGCFVLHSCRSWCRVGRIRHGPKDSRKVDVHRCLRPRCNTTRCGGGDVLHDVDRSTHTWTVHVVTLRRRGACGRHAAYAMLVAHHERSERRTRKEACEHASREGRTSQPKRLVFGGGGRGHGRRHVRFGAAVSAVLPSHWIRRHHQESGNRRRETHETNGRAESEGSRETRHRVL
mmetsp:Transcript_3880/g.24590  ORF Transcript_3880/g.24590 Transcript_3880/m.24590 type:complete len:243 (-) Transcript_3880:1959-2687(-)